MLILCRDSLIEHEPQGVFLGNHGHWIVRHLRVAKYTLHEIDIVIHLPERYTLALQTLINRTQDDRMTILIPWRKHITHNPNILLRTLNHLPPFVLNELPLLS